MASLYQPILGRSELATYASVCLWASVDSKTLLSSANMEVAVVVVLQR
jgi:hypothetical protein